MMVIFFILCLNLNAFPTRSVTGSFSHIVQVERIGIIVKWYKLSNVSKISWSSILGDRTQVYWKEKEKFVVVCLYLPLNVPSGNFTSQAMFTPDRFQTDRPFVHTGPANRTVDPFLIRSENWTSKKAGPLFGTVPVPNGSVTV